MHRDITSPNNTVTQLKEEEKKTASVATRKKTKFDFGINIKKQSVKPDI